jgi:hypothetical protein
VNPAASSEDPLLVAVHLKDESMWYETVKVRCQPSGAA